MGNDATATATLWASWSTAATSSACFAEAFVYLGSLLHRCLSDNQVADARIKKGPLVFGALRSGVFGSANVPGRLKRKLYMGGVLAVLTCDCGSWCLTKAAVKLLSSWQNKRVREMYRVAIRQTYVHQNLLQDPPATHGRVRARELPDEPRVSLGRERRAHAQEPPLGDSGALVGAGAAHHRGGRDDIPYGRFPGRYLKRPDLLLALTEWAPIAQRRADWRKRVTQPPLAIGKSVI